MFAHESYDVLVVGARCAGAATAMLMARQGLRVLVVDRGGHGTDTISTHALMRGGVLQLHRWGVLPQLLEMKTPPIRETTFHYPDEAVTVAVRAANGVDALYAPRRTLLDRVLVDAARQAGAVVRHGHTLVHLLKQTDGRVNGATVLDPAGNAVTIEADLVVGADGIGSAVARLAGAEVQLEGHHATSVVLGYFPGLELSDCHWWFSSGVSAGIIPTNHDRHCVFAAMPPGRLREWRDDKAAAFAWALSETDPALADLLAAVRPDEPMSVFAGRKGYLRQAFGPGWALVGDAGFFRDPLTAHGITDALRDAELLADAAAIGSSAAFTDYAATRDRLAMPLLQISDAVAALDWDSGRIKALHLALNQAMKCEVEHLLTLPDTHSPMIEEQEPWPMLI